MINGIHKEKHRVKNHMYMIKDKETVLHVYNGTLFPLKKRKKCCHLKQHGQTWRTFMLSEIPHGIA